MSLKSTSFHVHRGSGNSNGAHADLGRRCAQEINKRGICSEWSWRRSRGRVDSEQIPVELQRLVEIFHNRAEAAGADHNIAGRFCRRNCPAKEMLSSVPVQ